MFTNKIAKHFFHTNQLWVERGGMGSPLPLDRQMICGGCGYQTVVWTIWHSWKVKRGKRGICSEIDFHKILI